MHSIVIRKSLLYAYEEALGETNLAEPLGYLPEGTTVINQETHEPLEKDGNLFHMIYDPERGEFGFIKEDALLIFNRV